MQILIWVFFYQERPPFNVQRRLWLDPIIAILNKAGYVKSGHLQKERFISVKNNKKMISESLQEAFTKASHEDINMATEYVYEFLNEAE